MNFVFALYKLLWIESVICTDSTNNICMVTYIVDYGRRYIAMTLNTTQFWWVIVEMCTLHNTLIFLNIDVVVFNSWRFKKTGERIINLPTIVFFNTLLVSLKQKR